MMGLSTCMHTCIRIYMQELLAAGLLDRNSDAAGAASGSCSSGSGSKTAMMMIPLEIHEAVLAVCAAEGRW